MGETIADHLTARAGDDRAALIFEDCTWSWSQVVEQAAVRAAYFRARRDDGPFHIGVLLDNVPEYVFALFGAALAGATIVGLNSTQRGEPLAADIRHTDCQMVLTSGRGVELLAGLDVGPASQRVVDTEEYRSRLADHAGARVPTERPEPATLYLLLFTAGSTGAPKAVRMSQGRAARTASAAARAFGPDDILYCAMPLFHGNALVANLFPALIAGASVVLRRRFSASQLLPDVLRHGCTYFNYVGPALAYVLAVPESPAEGNTKLRWVLGSEASPRDIDEFTRRFGCPVFEGYGSSENAVVIAPGIGCPPGALGRPKRGIDAAIVDSVTGAERAPAVLDPGGRLLNPHEAIGEIVGRNVVDRFEGYYNNPTANAERTRFGWYWTGDLGYRDGDGYVYFAGRTADWLRVDGENFSAGSVEHILRRYQAARGVAVYGVPDSETGDQVMAAVEMPASATFDPADWSAFVANQPDLGTKWSPRFVRVMEALPLTAAGKIDKVSLRAQASVTDDAVWWRPEKDGELRPLTAADAAELERRFEAGHRSHLVPGGSGAGEHPQRDQREGSLPSCPPGRPG